MELIKTNIKGIYYVKNKNKTVTYYGKYRDPITKKSDRKKIITKEKHLSKYVNESRKLLDEIIKSIKNDTVNISDIEYNNSITLNQLSVIYFNHRINTKTIELKQHYNDLSVEEFEEDRLIQGKIYNTEKERLRYRKNCLDSDLGEMSLNQIRKAHINNYIENYLSLFKLSQKSVFMIISSLKTIINYGIREEIIDIKNPFAHITNKNPKRVRERALKPIELKMLLDECKKDINKSVFMSVYIAVITGARANTILNIKAKDIIITNEETSYIRLVNFKNKNKAYKIGLNKESTIFFQKILYDFDFNEYLIRPYEKYPKNKTKYKPMSAIPNKVYQIMDRMFNSHLDKSNNHERDMVCNFHSIRRSVATNLSDNGVSIYKIMNILNHSSVKQTEDYLSNKNKDVDDTLNELNHQIFNSIPNFDRTYDNPKIPF